MTSYEEVLSFERLRLSRLIEALPVSGNERAAMFVAAYKMKAEQARAVADDLSVALTELSLSIGRFKGQMKNV